MKTVVFSLLVAFATAKFLPISYEPLKVDEILSLDAISWPFKVCGSGAPQFTVNSLLLDFTPSKGVNEGIHLSGTATSQIAFKNVDIETYIGDAHLHTDNVAFTMVVVPGQPFLFEFNDVIPSFAPSVSFI
jgi:hypothetical protein